MVTQGIRDRKTLRVNYPMANKKRPGGRSESGGAADRLLHPQPAAESEEQAESRGVPALLRHGSHMEVAALQGNGTSASLTDVAGSRHSGARRTLRSRAVTAAHRQASANAGPGGKPPTILFMCPHGAAKSVLASAYLQRLAKERGLNVRVVSAGTDPDPEVAPAVATHLKKQGYEMPIAKPRRATDADMSGGRRRRLDRLRAEESAGAARDAASNGMTCRRRAKTLRALTKRFVNASFSSWTSSFASK